MSNQEVNSGVVMGSKPEVLNDFGSNQVYIQLKRTPATIQTVLGNQDKIGTMESKESIHSSNNDSIHGKRIHRQGLFLTSSRSRLSSRKHHSQENSVSPKIRQKEFHKMTYTGKEGDYSNGRTNKVHNYNLKNHLDEGQYDIGRDERVGSTYKYSNTDNSFRDLQSTMDISNGNVSSEISGISDNKTEITTPSSTLTSAANKLYNRMSNFFNNENNSIYSLSNNPSFQTLKEKNSVEKKKDKETGLDAKIRLGNPSREDELEEDEDHNRDQDPNDTSNTPEIVKTDKWKDDNKSLKHVYLTDTRKFEETLQEIQDFQGSFVQKYDNSIQPCTGELFPETRSRTMQKVLDYKDLYSEEEKPNITLNVKWSLRPGNSSYDYAFKMQHEAIMSEYTLIKLRFSSAIEGSSSETYLLPNEDCPSPIEMKSKTGILGFIDRSRYFSLHNPEEKVNNEPFDSQFINEEVDKPTKVDFENKDKYISQVWQGEVNSMFPIPDSFVPITSLSHTLDTPSIDTQREDCDIYQNANNNENEGVKSIDLSQMAKNVRFKRYVS